MKLSVLNAAVFFVLVVSRQGLGHDGPALHQLSSSSEQLPKPNSKHLNFLSDESLQRSKLTLGHEEARIITEEPSNCPVGFFSAGESKQCYRLYDDVYRTWHDAKCKCEDEKLKLAEPEDPVSVRLHLVENLGVNYYSWLGAEGNGSSQIWQSGEVLNNTSPYWFPGMSHNTISSSTNCLELDSTKYYLKHSPSTPYYSLNCQNILWTLCEQLPPCNPNCQNGATCNDAMECVCQPGWMGDHCDIACGKVNRQTKIVGGIATEIHEYPWQVLVLGKGLCGGSLINDRWVLSAAHCTTVGRSHTVTLGNHLLDETESAEIKLNVKFFIDHPNYNKQTSDYDFSLLELETSLNLASIGPHISPVCLPNADNPSQYDDVEAIVSGWGTTSYGGSVSNVLLETTVKTMTNSQCNHVNKYGGAIIDSMICAADAGKDSCQGDSGGPLVTKVGGYYNLIGVVSFGVGCAHSDYPGVYARVTHVIDWITSTTSQTGRSAYQN